MVVTNGALTSRHGEVPVSQSCVPSHVTLQTVGVGDPPPTIAPSRGGMAEKMATELNKPRHLGGNGTPYPRSGVAVDATAMMEGRPRGLPCLSVEGHLMAQKAKSRPILQKTPSGRESHANDKKEKKPPHHAAPFSRSSHGPPSDRTQRSPVRGFRKLPDGPRRDLPGGGAPCGFSHFERKEPS